MSSPWSLSASGGSSPWSASRVGIAAAAITPTGAVPPFGAALDLSTLPIDSEAFAEWARGQAEVSRRDDIAMAQANIDPAMHERELELAQNFERSGLSMTEDSFSNRDDGNENWFMRRANDLQTYARQTRNVLGQGAAFILSGPDLGEPDTWSYEDYRKAGGVLTETEFNSFSDATKTELGRRAQASQIRTDVTEAPGVSQAVHGLSQLYRGGITGIDMASRYVRGAERLEDIGGLFDRGNWGRAWRESDDRSIGSALVDASLRPIVSEDKLDEWRRHNSVYQMSALGTEIGALWYADPGVIAGQGIGNFRRVLHNEMPLNEASPMAAAVRESLQGREVISVRSRPAQKYASWRADRMREGRVGVEDYARNTDFATFSRLPMFYNRATDGVAAAKALHIAANSDNPDLMNLTWGVLNNEPHAFAQVDMLKRSTPEELQKYDPNASTFLNAMEATKTRASVLQQELEDLSKVDRAGSDFHRWELDTDIKIREDQLAQAERDLQGNLDYADWLELLGTRGLTQDPAGNVLDMGDPYHPRVSRIQAPKRERWNDVEERMPTRGPLRKFYMNNQFGYSHEAVRWTRNAWMNKAGTVSFHDIDSGPRMIDRYFEQLDNTLGYKVDPAITSTFVDRFVKAGTPQEKYRVLYEMEDLNLIPAMAQKLGISDVTVKAIWDKVNQERGRTYDGVMKGSGRVYSTAPSLGQRVGDEFNSAKLVTGPDDQGMVTLELMDGQKRTTVTVHESALQKRVAPEDVTQTVNYYQPADIRQLYYELKRHPEILADVDANLLQYGAANSAALIDAIGTKFYALWKPLQLWRPGWPQRVLMDEGLRAAAIFGPMYWLTGEGAKALGTGAYNLGLHSAKTIAGVPGWAKAKFDLRSHHKWLNDGPLGRFQKATPDAIRHDVEITQAPKFPASEFPGVNKSRFDRISKIGQAYSLKNHSEDAWRLNATEGRTLPALEASVRFDERELGVQRLGRPLDRFVEEFGAADLGDVPFVADLLTGKRLERGFFVPLPHIQTGINLREMDSIQTRNFHHWVEQNAELLSRQGIRSYADPEGNLGVGLWIGQASRKSGGPRVIAGNALRRIAESTPLEVDTKTLRMYDLGKRHTYYVESRDTLSPTQEALYRYFQGDPENLPDGTPGPAVDFSTLDERRLADPDHPQIPLTFNEVPESRIVRFGRRNPMLRQLHEAHAAGDLEQEHALMEALGLRYANGGKTNAFGQDWYEVTDADAFNRMVNEAEGLNRDFDWAAAANGDLRKAEQAYLETDRNFDLEDMDFQLDDPIRGLFERMKKKYGAGHTTIVGADGERFHLPNFYEGQEGEINRALTSSSKTIDNISDGHGGALQYLRQQAAGHKTYHAPVFNERTVMRGTKENKDAIRYFDMWADMLNDQVGNSPIWRRMLAGQSDERIVDWLENTPQGNRVRAEILPDHKSVELWVNEHRAKLDYYLPNRKLQRLLGKRRLSPSELRKGVHDDDMPDVFGPDLEMTKRAPWTRLADAMWKGLGTIPIDALSRQPFAKAVFDAKVRALVAQTDRKYLDEQAVGRIYAEARRHTLNEVRKTLYDLGDGTNLTDMLRFIAPFWNAQQEALMKWGRIISDRPETVARVFMGQRAVYRNFVVVDEEDNEVEDASRKGGLFNLGVYQPSDKVVFNLPEWVKDTPLGKALGSVGSVRIPIGSANTVLQGDMPLFPSTGPLITMPVDKFLKVISDTDGTLHSNDFWYRWMFPIGRPSQGTEGVLEQMLPGWGRRLLDATGPADDLGRANLAWSVGREMILEARREGKPLPTQHEINKAANFLWGLRAFTSWASPVQMEFAPEHQFWLDQAHRYRKQYGQDYFDQFLADFGKEAAYYAISSSNSLAHVPPTNQGMEEWAQNKDLIQKYPDFGGLIISPSAYTDDYSQDAYRAQFDIQLGPLDSRKLRSIQDPQARMNEGERLLGWQEFRKIQAAVDSALMERGLTSIQSRGAEDLAQLKAQAMTELRSSYPAWATDFDTFNNDIDTKVHQLESFAFEKQFDNRPDIAGLRQYLVVRAMAAEQLDAAYAAGGSRSLQAEENASLAAWFYDQTGQIIQSNPAFAELYAMHLTGDTLMRGSG